MTSSSSIFDHLKSNFYYSVQSAMRILTRNYVESEQVACDADKTVLNPELGVARWGLTVRNPRDFRTVF